MSLILSINSGIGSSVGVFQDGSPILCLEEERFNRVKNWFGFPDQSLNYILNNKICKIENVDHVALAGESSYQMDRETYYGAIDHHFNQAFVNSTSFVGAFEQRVKKMIRGSALHSMYVGIRHKNKIEINKTDQVRKKLHQLGFDDQKIVRVNHHLCHAASAYYGLGKNLDHKYLIFTLDGGGDEITSSISIGHQGVINKLSESDCFSVGNLFSSVTYFLGFRPHEHEYKLMGLAPYVDPKYIEKYKDYFAQFVMLKDNDTIFYNPFPLDRMSFFKHLYLSLKNDRFDNIAAGLQAFTEEIVVKWMKGNIKKYGIKKVLLGGGVFMNVKLNMLLSQQKEVEYIDVFPSCGDESNIFGAAFDVYNNCYKRKVDLLKHYTIGTTPEYDLEVAINRYIESVSIEMVDNPNKYIAEQLNQNKIVGRCSGPMEFGARALGNRSILANPSNLNNVNKINQAVKKRDFWMPFAPAILAENANDIIKIPDSLKEQGSPYMMFAFDTAKAYREKIIGGIHQADYTARAEIITKEKYPDFHDIINEFYSLSGVACVLNTSFNLHGFPIVENSTQAIEVLINSKIDVLVINNTVIKRKG